jgi:hypothetical protein
VIVIKRHRIIGGLTALFLVFLWFVGDIFFIWGIVIFTCGGILLVFFCLEFCQLALSFSIFFMSSSTVGVVEVFAIDAFSSLPSGGGGVISCPPVLDIFSSSD